MLKTNTYNFGQCGLGVGTIIRLIEWNGTEETRPRLEITSKTTGKPFFGDKTQNIKLNAATRLAHSLNTGELLHDYIAMDMWETETDNIVLREFVTDPSEFHGIKKHTRLAKKPAHPYLDIHTPTVYSHLRTATDVLRSDIPEAAGYNPKSSELWNSYLDGGDGALSNKKMSRELFASGWKSDCCDRAMKTVAGIDLCSHCGGEFVCSALMTEGS